MIQPTELRLNNWVYSIQLGKEVQISGIDSDGDVAFLNDNIWDCNEPDTIEPIALSEEVLMKCGFKVSKSDDNFFCQLIKNGIVFNSDYLSGQLKLKVYIIVNDIRIEIQYLHQLQNLYFALTNQELIYKP